MVAIGGMRLVLMGGAIGLGAAAVVSRVIASLLFGVSALDPLTYAIALAGVVLLALIASIEPALRAASVDPAQALRSGN